MRYEVNDNTYKTMLNGRSINQVMASSEIRSRVERAKNTSHTIEQRLFQRGMEKTVFKLQNK